MDFASSGSSQIGGNISTNAGGIKVIRHGMTRDWVAGVKVVTGTGELLDLNRALVKNNAGYDLRHLVIGAEGTLGIVVEATMRLARRPGERAVLVLGAPDMAAIMTVLSRLRDRVALQCLRVFLGAGPAAKWWSTRRCSDPLLPLPDTTHCWNSTADDGAAMEPRWPALKHCVGAGLGAGRGGEPEPVPGRSAVAAA